MDNWAMYALLSTLIIPLMVWYFKHIVEKREQSELNERRTWQKGAIERHASLVKRVESIQRCLLDVKTSLNDKLDKEDFERSSEEKWERMNHHEHLIECDSSACTAKKTSGVII